MKKAFVLFLVVLILAGCGASSKHQNIFENPVCEAPCWEKITPGVTTKEDALAILSQIDAVDQPVRDHNEAGSGFDDWISFSLYGDVNRLGEIDILDGRVSLIDFGFKLGINLEHAIEMFGAPQSVLVIHAGEFDGVTLLNPNKGIALSYTSSKQLSEIKSSDEITGVSFFDPKQYSKILASGIFSFHQLKVEETLDRLRPWNGYGDLTQDEKQP
jgi:hypothetical protein